MTAIHPFDKAVCGPPPRDLTVEHAHTIMQQHNHATPHCPPRQAALALLVTTGHYRLPSNRQGES